MSKKIIIVAGPTASGKTSFGIKLAEALSGEIINADSMQVYLENPIISAQPTDLERKNIKHHLFGYVKGDEEYTIARWINDAVNKINSITSLPILVGGTGFYIKHLMTGLSAIPDVPHEISKNAEELLERIGKVEFYNQAVKLDQNIAGKIDPNNTKKVMRAYEVFASTGRSIYDWQKENVQHFLIKNFQLIILMPKREIIYENCNKRFLQMLENNVLDEVKYLSKQNYSMDSGVMKSHGVPELCKYLSGEWNLSQAIEKSQQNTRNYAKRQITWLKHQFNNLEIKPCFIEDPEKDIKECLKLCNYFFNETNSS